MRRIMKEIDIEVEFDVEGIVEMGDLVLNYFLMVFFYYMGRNVWVKVNYDFRYYFWEDVGIILGLELREKFLGKFVCFGSVVMLMDDVFILVVFDIFGRFYLNFEFFLLEEEEGFSVTFVREFFWGLVCLFRVMIYVK